MTVHVEMARGWRRSEAAARALSGKIKSNVGISAKVDVARAGQVARSEGKAVRIIDNRPQGELMARGLARDHDEKRAALRKGAAAYFAAHGFDRASMTGAAKSCGVSKALIYHYWSSKRGSAVRHSG